MAILGRPRSGSLLKLSHEASNIEVLSDQINLAFCIDMIHKANGHLVFSANETARVAWKRPFRLTGKRAEPRMVSKAPPKTQRDQTLLRSSHDPVALAARGGQAHQGPRPSPDPLAYAETWVPLMGPQSKAREDKDHHQTACEEIISSEHL